MSGFVDPLLLHGLVWMPAWLPIVWVYDGDGGDVYVTEFSSDVPAIVYGFFGSGQVVTT